MLSQKSKQYIYFAVVIHLLAVYFSVGYYNLDEQTQVLQLVGFKLGQYDISFLSDQYTHAIRAWFHPALFLYLSKFLNLFSTFNPFIHAFYYRLLSSLIGLVSLGVLYKTFETELIAFKAEEYYFYFAAILWFFPFLHARTSNENLTGSFFIFALYFLKQGKNVKHFIWAGILFTGTFVLRFQMIVMILSVLLYFFIAQKKVKEITILIISAIITLGISTWFDSYMYGHFTFAPYNYFHLNIIEKYANSFGVNPIYQYFIFIFRECFPPLGIMVILVFVYFWSKFPKHLLTVITLPFFIVHSLIGHKEFRFIFPLAPFLPLLMAIILCHLKWERKKKLHTLFLVFNLPMLAFFIFSPATNTYRLLHYYYYEQKPIETIYVFAPHEDFSRFFLKKPIVYPVIKKDEIKTRTMSDKNVYFLTKSVWERDLILAEKQCVVSFSLYPKWVYDYEFIKKRRTFRSWSIVECIN